MLFRSPKEALRLVDFVQEADDDSSAPPVTVTKTGVYAFVNGRSEFREVSVVHEGSDYYVVRPIGRKILRNGDYTITEGTGLQDGLLIAG